MIHSRVLVHTDGPAIWPEKKSADEWALVKATTTDRVWAITYQGARRTQFGAIFKREWFAAADRRFPLGDQRFASSVVARYLAIDTAAKAHEKAAYTAIVVGELLGSYQLAIRYVWRARVEFPELLDVVTAAAIRWNTDGRLRGVIIEDKSSGTSALQTLKKQSDPWLAELLRAFVPTTDKDTRLAQAAIWAREGMILLPVPVIGLEWLYTFEEELFAGAASPYRDQTDAAAMLVLWLENILSAGFMARRGQT